MILTVRQTIVDRAERAPDSPVLLAPDRPTLDSRELCALVERVAGRLHELGVRRGDRVALSLPGGPESATAFLCAASVAAAAPLNPTYRRSEFDFYLADLGAVALVVPEEELASGGPAVESARELGVAVLGLSVPEGAPAGVFELSCAPIARDGEAGDGGSPTAEDVALVLHTSGTTSRPKVVPLSQRNLAASARNILTTLRLSPADRALNVMPLFHIHGLLGALLSSLHAGASVVATPGFSAPRFLAWLRELEPTWYSAVPTMHQAVLARAAEEPEAARDSTLRLIRSSSSALAPSVLAELERVFGVPVIEAYGMTEAAHQMACNPLPPAARKPGSVGPAAGPEVCILDEDWRPLPPGGVGEVAIRGENVTAGYEANPEANAAAFRDGWFRTGDQGTLDEDGYLFLTGRLKEIINRGGEKISPREIDEVLLEHPDVAQAVAFAMPDPKLGEDVAAAVVLEAGAAPDKRALLAFAAERLADFKLPRELVFLDEIPKGPTGKLQRIGLAERLGVGGGAAGEPTAAESRPPATETERLMVELFRELLEVERVDTGSDFFALGGDSLLAAELVRRVAEATGVAIPVWELFEEPSAARLAAYVDAAEREDADATTLPGAGEGPHELGFAQGGLWVQERLAGGTPINHRLGALRLTGPLDRERLAAALTEVVGAHEMLRARFPVVGRRPVQELAPAESVELPLHEFAELAPDERGRGSAERARELAARGFDLAAGPVARFELHALAEEEHLLAASVHHIAFDGWSMSVLANQLAAAYRRPGSARSETRYADWALWQHERVESGAWKGQIDHWREVLGGGVPELELEGAVPRAGANTAEGVRGARRDLVVPRATRAALLELGRAEGATLFMTLLAAFDVLLLRWSGSEDVVLGTLVAGRGHPRTRDVIGLFANSLVLRTDLSGDPTFRQLLARVREVALGAYANADVPFEVVVRELAPPMVMGRNPYFDVVFQLRNLPEVRAEADGLTLEDAGLEPGFARFDLLVEAFEERAELHTRFEYRTARFGEELMTRQLLRWGSLLESVAADPDRPLSRIALD